jgi:hypothetical protein
MFLLENRKMTNSRAEFIEALYVVAIYKPPKVQVNCCNSIL